MDAARARLIGTLERLSMELESGSTLAQCLRRLPRVDYHCLCAPLSPGSQWRWRWQPPPMSADEAVTLARIALAAGAEDPERLAVSLAQLATDLREAGP